MEKIKCICERELEKLWFEEYEEWYFVLRSDIWDIEYHLKENILIMGVMREDITEYNTLKKIVNAHHKLWTLIAFA